MERKPLLIGEIKRKLGRIAFPNFGKRPAHTLLFVTDTKTFRLDVDKTGAPLGDVEPLEVGCPAPAKLADCIGQVAAGREPFGRKTWVLFARLPMAAIGMPTVQLEGLDEPSLVQALLFELERLSGQSMLDMQPAYRVLGDKDEMSAYWVCLFNRLQLEDADKAVKKAGSRLAGLLHPAALPAPLADAQAEDWLRLECWPTQLAAVRSNGGGMSLQLFSFESRHWRSHLEQWLAAQGDVGHTETLHSEMLSNKSFELLPETGYTLNLGNVDTLEGWLVSWAGVLLQKEPPVPVLRFASERNQDLLMVSGAAAALAICSGHLVWNLYQAKQFDDQVAKL